MAYSQYQPVPTHAPAASVDVPPPPPPPPPPVAATSSGAFSYPQASAYSQQAAYPLPPAASQHTSHAGTYPGYPLSPGYQGLYPGQQGSHVPHAIGSPPAQAQTRALSPGYLSPSFQQPGDEPAPPPPPPPPPAAPSYYPPATSITAPPAAAVPDASKPTPVSHHNTSAGYTHLVPPSSTSQPSTKSKQGHSNGRRQQGSDRHRDPETLKARQEAAARLAAKLAMQNGSAAPGHATATPAANGTASVSGNGTASARSGSSGSARHHAAPGSRAGAGTAKPPSAGKPPSGRSHGHAPSQPHAHSHKAAKPVAPPTLPSASSPPALRGPESSRLNRDTPFLAHIKFKNDLPEIPSDPKMLVSAVRPEALAAFQLTSLESTVRRDLHVAPAIHVTPLDIDRFRTPEGAGELDPADVALFKDSNTSVQASGASGLVGPAGAQLRGPAGRNFGQRSKALGLESVGWLMKTTYVSNEIQQLHKQGVPEKQAVQMQQRREEDLYASSRDKQVAAILDTFEAVKRPLKHLRDPSLQPVEVMPLLPDFVSWPIKYTLAQFEGDDPMEDMARAGAVAASASAEARPLPKSKHFVGHTLMKGFKVDEMGSEAPVRIMALLTPRDMTAALAAARSQETLKAQAPDTRLEGSEPSDLEGDYDWVKEYKYDLARDKSTYILRLGQGAARYFETAMHIKLKRRDVKAGRTRGRDGEDEEPTDQFQRPSKVVISSREANDVEINERVARAQQYNFPLPPDLRQAHMVAALEEEDEEEMQE